MSSGGLVVSMTRVYLYSHTKRDEWRHGAYHTDMHTPRNFPHLEASLSHNKLKHTYHIETGV